MLRLIQVVFLKSARRALLKICAKPGKSLYLFKKEKEKEVLRHTGLNRGRARLWCRICTRTGTLYYKESAQCTLRHLTEQKKQIPEDSAVSEIYNPICLEAMSEPPSCAMPCYHNFHHDCITLWMTRGSNCPLCNAHVSARLLKPFKEDVGKMWESMGK